MRDYLACHTRTGTVMPIAQVPNSGIAFMLSNADIIGVDATINPGVTKQAFIERVKLEIFIRENNLRGD